MDHVTRYRNVFAETGKTPEEIESRLRAAVDAFFFGSEDERIYHDAGPDMGYVCDTGNDDARTEGMSYGMMMCVQLGMKEQFDRIWKWTKTYMYHDEEGWFGGYFAWSCNTDGTRRDQGPAPDGEEYFAMALILASRRWGDGEGIFNYSREARDILRTCLHKGEDGVGEPMWNRDNRLILFVPGSPHTDPSYHLPHFYDIFAECAYEEDRPFWREAAEASRAYLAKACHPVTGLNPEYSEFDGSPHNRVMTWTAPDGRVITHTHGQFYSDAYRTAANIGLDSLWNGASADRGQQAAPLRMMRFFGTDLEAVRCVYEPDGTPLPERTVLHPLGLIAAAAQGAITVPYEDNAAPGSDWAVAAQWVEWLWAQPPRKGVRRYYDNCLYIFALLALSGKYRYCWD